MAICSPPVFQGMLENEESLFYPEGRELLLRKLSPLAFAPSSVESLMSSHFITGFCQAWGLPGTQSFPALSDFLLPKGKLQNVDVANFGLSCLPVEGHPPLSSLFLAQLRGASAVAFLPFLGSKVGSRIVGLCLSPLQDVPFSQNRSCS